MIEGRGCPQGGKPSFLQLIVGLRIMATQKPPWMKSPVIWGWGRPLCTIIFQRKSLSFAPLLDASRIRSSTSPVSD